MAGPSPADVKSIAEHWDILWVLVVGLFGIVLFLIWRIISRIEKSIEKIYDCMANMVSRAEFAEWKTGRTDLKMTVENHSHAPDGRIIINRS